MQEKNEKSLSFILERENPWIFTSFSPLNTKNLQKKSFISLKFPTKSGYSNLQKHKTWPMLPLKTRENLLENQKPKKNQPTIEKKPTFFSQNSCNLSSFINTENKSLENPDKNNEENGFNISFHGNRMLENQANLHQSLENHANLHQSFIEEQKLESPERISEDNQRIDSRIIDNLNTANENREEGINNTDFEVIYRYSLKLFMFKTLKNHFFAHLFMFAIIMKFLFDLNSIIIFLIDWISDFFNFFYYIHKICLSKRIYK